VSTDFSVAWRPLRATAVVDIGMLAEFPAPALLPSTQGVEDFSLVVLPLWDLIMASTTSESIHSDTTDGNKTVKGLESDLDESHCKLCGAVTNGEDLCEECDLFVNDDHIKLRRSQDLNCLVMKL
jgi:hypothetical protein